MLQPLVVLNSKTSVGVGRSIFCKDYKVARITVATSGLTTGKQAQIFCKTSNQEEDSNHQFSAPDFSAAKSLTNRWDYVQMIKVADNTPVDGAVGDIIAGADDVRVYEINTDGQVWFTLDLGALSAGVTVYADVLLFNEKN